MNGCPPWALDDEMLTIRPQPSSSISGTTAWQQLNVPVRLTSRMRFQSSRLIFRNGSNPWRPALFTRIVGRPRRARTSATPASICCRSVTSTVNPIDVPPAASILAAVSSAELPSRSNTATAAPSVASRSLMARPIPEPPPVTIAVRPEVMDGVRSLPEAVEKQIPQLLGRVGTGLARRSTDRRGERVEHDRLEDDAGHAVPVETAANGARLDRVVVDLFEERHERREGPRGLARVGRHQLLGELGEGEGRRPLLGGLLRRGPAQGVVLDYETVEALARVLLARDALLNLSGGRPHGLLEQGEQQLLLAAEVLIEAPQRLPRLLDDVLHGEVLTGGALAQQVEGGVDEALHAALGAHPGGVERPRHGLLAPTGGRRFGGGLVGGHAGNHTAQIKRSWFSQSQR